MKDIAINNFKEEKSFEMNKTSIEKINKIANIVFNPIITHKKNRSSFLINSLFIVESSIVHKFILFLKFFLLPHCCAYLLTILKIILQKSKNNFCWMPQLCTCDINFQKRLFDIFLNIFIEYNFVAITFYYCLVDVIFKTNKAYAFFFYYSLCLTITFIYVWTYPIEELFVGTYLSFFYFGVALLFNLKLLPEYQYNLKKWLIHAQKMFIPTCYVLHNAIVQFGFSYLNNQMPPKYKTYLIPLYQFIYFKLLFFAAIGLLGVYLNYLKTWKTYTPIQTSSYI